MKKLIFAAVTVGLATGLALGAVEFYLRYQMLGSASAVWAELVSGAAPYSNLGSEGRVIYDPELSYRLNPAQPQVNSIGIRNAEIEREKTPGRLRIIVIGDSVAWPENGFVHLLSEKLGALAEVINAAIPGYTVYQERILLERYLIDYKPDLIIQQYCLNDNLRFLHRFTQKGGMIWTQEAQRALFPEHGDPLAWLPSGSYLAVRLRLTYTRWTKPRGEFPWEDAFDFVKGWQDDGWAFFREQFGLIRQSADSVGARLTVVMFPFAPQFRSDLLAKDEDYVLKPQRLMKEICDEAGVPLLDMYPVLKDAGGAELLPDRIHLSDEGHRITADALYEHLVANGLIPAVPIATGARAGQGP